MNPRLGSLAFAALAAALVVPVARAMDMDQMSSGRIVSFGLGGGVSVPVSDAADAFKTGFNGQGFVRFNLKVLPIAPRVDFTFSKFNLADDVKVGTTGTTGTTGTSQMLAGVANLQYSLIRSGPVRPYIVAGLGAYNFKTDLDNAASGSTSDTRFGVNGGAGVVFKLGHALSAYVEGRLDNVFTDKGLIATDQIQVVPVTFGVVF